MIKERYCSFEVAKLLKEKGFVIPCDWIYCSDGTFGHKNSLWDKEMFLAPTHQMACDWLREKGFYIEIQTIFDEFEPSLLKFTNFHAVITTIIDGRVIDETHLADEGIRDYGECVENAMDYCLTELMKGGEE